MVSEQAQCPTAESSAVAAAKRDAADVRQIMGEAFAGVRRFSDQLCEPLEPEDCVIQSMPDVSPTRWHLAHTTWFFETFVLKAAQSGFVPVDPAYEYLFNSYYNAVGPQYARPRRGLLSRPTVAQVLDYRAEVDRRMHRLLAEASDETLARFGSVIEIGLHHEQQHQELMLTDIKHVFAQNPLHPVYVRREPDVATIAGPVQWCRHDGGLREFGYGGDGFCYDNERPRHCAYVGTFELADRLVTCGEFLEFIEDGGYANPLFWLSDGWTMVQEQQISAPLYWQRRDGTWHQFTLSGLRLVQSGEPLCHVSFYEADAYARWASARLPTEYEWELAAAGRVDDGHFADSGRFHPVHAKKRASDESPRQLFGDAWEWTASPYVAYPGFSPGPGALGEYNGKFMCNQMVLRGGSCATPPGHIRATYRNFFPPHARWQFSGLRLARSV